MAVALERGAALRAPVDEPAQLRAAAIALGMDEHELGVVARNDYYRVFSENGSGGVAVVDGLGSVALAERSRRVLCGEPGGAARRARAPPSRSTRSTSGRGAAAAGRARERCAHRRPLRRRRAEDLLAGARPVLAEHAGDAVAVVFS